MSNDIKDLEPGDLAWVAVDENDTANMAMVVEATPNQVSLRLDDDSLLVADPSKLFILEKWWGHGPLGDGTGMGPTGFDIDRCDPEDIEEFPWLDKC